MSFRLTAFLAAGAAIALGSSSGALAQVSTQTCALSSYCALITNTSSGPAFHGKGNTGYGVVGNSTSGSGVLGSSASGVITSPGIEGESTNNDGDDAAGAFGLAAAFNSTVTPPASGVLAFGMSYGSYGQTLAPGTSSSSGFGVFGADDTRSVNGNNVGVGGSSNSGTGVLGEANGTPSVGIKGVVPIGIYAVADKTSKSTAGALFSESNSFAFEAVNTTTNSIVDISSPSDLLNAQGTGSNVFSVDLNANVATTGTVTSTGGFQTNARAASGLVRTSYAPHATSPVVEDTGDAQLVGGRAAVSIDASLADVIDMRRGYHVFLTPNGDCKGLFVAEKTRYGFVVRELQGGRSNLAFDYRIVAKPLAEDGQRLAVVRAQSAAPHLATSSGFRPARFASQPLDPKAALLQKLGPAGYAKAVRAFEQRRTTL